MTGRSSVCDIMIEEIKTNQPNKESEILKINNITVKDCRTPENEKAESPPLKSHLNVEDCTDMTRKTVKRVKDPDSQEWDSQTSNSLKELDKPAWLSEHTDSSESESEILKRIPINTVKADNSRIQAHPLLPGNSFKMLYKRRKLHNDRNFVSSEQESQVEVNSDVQVGDSKQLSITSHAATSDIQNSGDSREEIQLIQQSADANIVNQKEDLYAHFNLKFGTEDNNKATLREVPKSLAYKMRNLTELSEILKRSVSKIIQSSAGAKVEMQTHNPHSQELAIVQQKKDPGVVVVSENSYKTTNQPDENVDGAPSALSGRRRCVVVVEHATSGTHESGESRVAVQPNHGARGNTEIESSRNGDVSKQFRFVDSMNENSNSNSHQARNMVVSYTSHQIARINNSSLSATSCQIQPSQSRPITLSGFSSATCTVPREYTKFSVLQAMQRFYKVNATIIDIYPSLSSLKDDFERLLI